MMMENNIEAEMDRELKRIEIERITDEIEKAKDLRNQALELRLTDLMRYDKEADIIGLGGAISLLEILSDFNDEIYRLKEKLDNISD